jgi:trans-aconitate 2-methyltransferase
MTHEFEGRKYEQASKHQKEWGERLIEELDLQGSERILDLGCGDGTLTAQISTLVPNGEVLGIDASQGMIEVARQKQAGNVQFVLKDINNLDFSDEFDVIFSNATLHWVKDHRRLLDGVRRALKMHGVARFNFGGEGNCSHFLKVIRGTLRDLRFSKYFVAFEWPWYMPSVEDYSVLVRNSEFRRAQVWGENADRFFPDSEAMIKWIDQPSIVPFLACVSQEDKIAFRELVVSRMIEETRQADGTCFETFRRINLLARK